MIPMEHTQVTNMKKTTNHTTYNERVSAVERDVQHLSDSVSGLSREVRTGFEEMRDAISKNRTPVTQLAGWATVIIALVAAVLWPQIQTDTRHDLHLVKLTEAFTQHISDGHPRRVEDQVHRNRDDLDWLRNQLENHMKSEGHPTAITRIESLEEGLKLLDESLQREMRLLDDSNNARNQQLDISLQREMDLKDKLLLEKIKTLEKQIEKLNI